MADTMVAFSPPSGDRGTSEPHLLPVEAMSSSRWSRGIGRRRDLGHDAAPEDPLDDVV